MGDRRRVVITTPLDGGFERSRCSRSAASSRGARVGRRPTAGEAVAAGLGQLGLNQAYGLDAVLAEYEHSGEIPGTHNDALEGYDWPLDGRHDAPDEKPKVPAEVVRPPGYAFDPDRREPPEGVRPLLG